jgi:hypothetical protein
MERPIVEFRQDEVGDWIADLACGHHQHVRHRPPFFPQPWILTAEGRRGKVGTDLECPECDETR